MTRQVPTRRFSANLGFLWTDRPLIEAVKAAHLAGFDAVECHWPYDTDPDALLSVLKDTGLEMLCLNTSRGDVQKGMFGLCALPGRESEARNYIDQALTYADKVGIPNIHVMAGIAEGASAEQSFISNLQYACDAAKACGKTILIEPINTQDVPGYFLKSLDEAIRIIALIDAPNLKLMFDCYHIQLIEGDVIRNLSRHLHHIGHIQFASVPSRGAPDGGELDYHQIFAHISSLGYDQPLGAEYRPKDGDTDASLGWLREMRK